MPNLYLLNKIMHQLQIYSIERTYSQDNGAAFEAGGLEVGQLILEVDGHKVEGNFTSYPQTSYPIVNAKARTKPQQIKNKEEGHLMYHSISCTGLHHQEVARLIAESFARRDRSEIEFLVVEAKKSNLEPKPTALIFLEA